MNNQDELKQAKFLSVSALNRYLAYKFDVDIHLQTVYLEGEISNCKRSGKNIYFSIKDEYSEISGMMFYPNTTQIDFELQDGMVVQMVGKVGVYEKRGTYSIIVKKMIKAGIGLLYQEFLDLKDKLEKEGLFDKKFKLKLPEFPKTIGVITSATGEAINDIISTLKKRMPFAKVVLYPAIVQGQDAPKDLIRALLESYNNQQLDCLIIGRGGGSFEDLACFNDEQLSRCLFNAPFPTISAVGHEGDYTICDFVASYRAPTPTGAAMLVVRDQNEVLENINILRQRVLSGYRVFVNKTQNKLESLLNSYGIANFDKLIDNQNIKCNVLIERLKQYSPVHSIERQIELINHNKETIINIFKNYINANYNVYAYNYKSLNNSYTKYLSELDNDFNKLLQKLIILNPLNIMSKGYSITYQGNKVISSVKEINYNENIKIKLVDGEILTNIIEIKED